MNNGTLIETIGWAGVFFYVFAYLLLTAGVLKSDGYYFHLFNILGATGLIINSYHHSDNPNLVVNSIWLVIGLFAITRRYLSRSGR